MRHASWLFFCLSYFYWHLHFLFQPFFFVSIIVVALEDSLIMGNKEEKKAKRKEKREGLWQEFKKFISRGSVVDMSVGVIMGSAFGAIVTAFTNILLSVCTWGVPGGLKGLVTVLPALNDAQKGMDVANGLGQKFDAAQLQDLATAEANVLYTEATVTENPNLIESVKSTILSKYTLHGTQYTYNMSAVIDWGTCINAIISFLIIALTLFVIVKTYNWSRLKREELKKKMEEEYYEKHPEERPVPPEPGKPAVTEIDVLNQIRDELRTMNAQKSADQKTE